jgi:lipoprotein-releasing system permease protein
MKKPSMFRPLSLYLGMRYTRAEKNNRFLSFISLISTLGLMLGVAVLITVLSVMNGFDYELRTRILGTVSQASVYSPDLISDWQPLVEIAEDQPNVLGAAPFTQMQGMLTANGQVTGALINGIEPVFENRVSILGDHMIDGSLESLDLAPFSMVVGEQLARGLGLSIGDKITMVLPEASASAAGVVPRFKRFTITGVFNISPEVDSSIVYISLNDASTLLRLPDGAQGVRMKLEDIFQAPQAALNLVDVSGMPLYPADWTQTHGNLFGAIKMEKAMVGLLLFFIILVAAFNIVSSLVMAVSEKQSDIAILRTMGATPRLIRRVFMIQGVIVGLTGTLIGGVFGVIFALTISDFFAWVNTGLGLNLLDAYFINYLPSKLDWFDVALVCSATITLSFLATIYPAARAAKVKPAEALRYE